MTAMMMRVSMCEFYTGIYEGGTSMSNSEVFRKTLVSALPEFHATVIVFSVKTREYFNAAYKIILIVYIQKNNPKAIDNKH